MKSLSTSLVLPLLLWWTFAAGSTAHSPVLDSLWNIWKDTTLHDTTRLEVMDRYICEGFLYSQPDSAFNLAQMVYDFARERGHKKYMALAFNIQGISYRVRGDYARALEYYQKCLAVREEIGDKKGVAGSLNNIGLIYANQDQYANAIEYYTRSLKIYEEIGYELGIANVLNNIGIIYVNHRDKSRALDYFERSLKINELSGDKKAIAGSLTNIGNIYTDQGNLSKALEYHQKGLIIYKEVGDKRGIADCMLNIGDTYNLQGQLHKALEYYQQCREIYEEIGDKYGIVNARNGIGSIHGRQGDHYQAIRECQKGWQLAREIGTIATQKNSAKCLYEAYKALGNTAKALEFHEQILELNDSLRTEETANQLERMEFQKQMLADSLRQEEEKLRMQLENEESLAKEERKRNMAIGGGIFFILLAASLYSRVRYMRKSNAVIEKERDRSENLLLNILPAEIATELKEKGRAAARDFEQVTILFTDFKEFTQTSMHLSAQKLVEEINTCFEAFDNICEIYGIEKIKTIGDAYMAAGGLPVQHDNSAKNTVLAGLAMAEYIRNRQAELKAAGQISFEMRVGIHTGPVVAGIVGVKKFQYDIWGDTVNTASRMESYCKVGKVNISHDTYLLIRNDPQFRFESRGKVKAKGKGEVEMWYVEPA